MKIKIRLATLSDLNKLMDIFDTARCFMQSTGNTNQWINGYPQRELIMHEINSGHCYVCINEQESVVLRLHKRTRICRRNILFYPRTRSDILAHRRRRLAG